MLVFTCLLIIISLSAVSASDTIDNQTLTSGIDGISMLEINSNEVILTSMDEVDNESDVLGESLSNDNVLSDGDGGSFKDLNDLINGDATKTSITLQGDYVFDSSKDADYVNGIVIDRQLTIIGNGFTIDASNQARIFQVSSSVQLSNITFKNANALTGSGGAIYMDGASDCIVKNCTFINNTAAADGGAVFMQNSNGDFKNITFTYCHFEGNNASGDGAAVKFLKDAYNCTIEYSNFINNYAFGDGGAVFFNGTNGTIKSVYFKDNTAGDDGGAIFWQGTYGSIDTVKFINNNGISLLYGKQSSSRGGTICLTGDKILLTNSSFKTSSVTTDVTDVSKLNGGAVFVTGNDVNITKTSFDDCYSINTGGAIHIIGNNTLISGCNFTNCVADANGGVIYVTGNNANITRSNFSKSHAALGGAIYVNGESADIGYCNFDENYANGGGALFWAGQSSGDVIQFSNFTKNRAISGDGGAIYWSSNGNLGLILNSTFKENYAYESGGGIYWTKSSNGTVEYSTFIANRAEGNGGALFWNGVNGTVEKSLFENNYAAGLRSHQNYAGGGAISWSAVNGLFDRCDFINNTSPYHAGVVYGKDAKNLTINYCNMINNSASEGAGGVLYFETSEGVHFYNSNFTNNYARSAGVLQFNLKCDNADIINCTFTDNHALEYGAVSWNINNGLIYNSTFIHNYLFDLVGSKDHHAGAVSFGGSYNTIDECRFINNTIDGSTFANSNECFGAAVYYSASNSKIINTNFTGNYNTGIAGALFITVAYAEAHDLRFINNTATTGGAITLRNKNGAPVFTDLYNMYFENNSAQYGGAINCEGIADCSVYNATFVTNHGYEGGAIRWTGTRGHIYDCNFTDNKADLSNYGSWAIGGTIHWSGSEGILEDININKSYSVKYGGSITWTGNTGTLKNINITNSSAGTNAGGLYIKGSSVTLSNSNLDSCSATINSGGVAGSIMVDGGSYVTLNNINITNSHSKSNAGAIQWTGNFGTLQNVNITNSSAGVNGGAILISGTITNTITNSNFTNTSAKNGGAIYITGNTNNGNNRVTVSKSLFNMSKASAEGGAIYSESYNTLIELSNFTDCTAGTNGGAIVIARANQNINNCTFDGNNATQKGGAIYVKQVLDITISDSTFTNSHAYDGGAIYNLGSSGASLKILNSTFIKNIATHNGGAVYYIVDNANARTKVTYRDFNKFDGEGVIKDGRTTLNMTANGATYENVIYTSLFEDNEDYLFNVTTVVDSVSPIAIVTISNPKDIDKQSLNIVIKLTSADDNRTITITKSNYANYFNVEDNSFNVNFYNLTQETTYKVTVGFKDNYYMYKENVTTIDVGDYTTKKGDFEILQDLIEKAIGDGKNFIDLTRNYQYTPTLDKYCMNITDLAGLENFTINGHGYVIDALDFCRIFNITADNVNINNVTFINGDASGSTSDDINKGGALFWAGKNGVLSGVVFRDNAAEYGGGLYFNSTADNCKIINCQFFNNDADENGGAIDCNATRMNLTNTLFEENYANVGAALCREERATGGFGYNNTFNYNHAVTAGAALAWIKSESITIDKYTFVGNTAGYSGGAIYVGQGSGNCTVKFSTFIDNYITSQEDGHGGAIEWYAANGTVLNSTFRGNYAPTGGAIYVGSESGQINITHSGFLANYAYKLGGAIDIVGSSIAINNSYFRENYAPDGGAIFVGGKGHDNFVYLSYFTGNNATSGCGGAISWNATTGVIYDSNFTNNNALYGGAIYIGGTSPNSEINNVIFKGNNATFNGGAIDWNATGGRLFNTTFIENYAGQYGAALCREANATGGSGKNNTFIANHAGIGGAALGWIESARITIDDYHFYNNTADVHGGAIYIGNNSDNCTIKNSIFEGNTVPLNGNIELGFGGAIVCIGHNTTVINSNFTKNKATNGGAIYASGASGNTNITDAIFKDNYATYTGGAIALRASAVSVNNTKFYNNTAADGGALYVGGTGITNFVYLSDFENNTATNGNGGAINWVASAGEIIESNFTNNSATYGGALYLGGNAANSRIVNVTFDNNYASKNGGAIDCNAKNMTLLDTLFINNVADEYGAALCREFNATGGSGKNNTFTANHAGIAGAALAWMDSVGIKINDYHFYNNTAGLMGGAIYANPGSDNCTINNSVFKGNKVLDVENGLGGAIDFASANATLLNSNFTENTAAFGGALNVESNGGSTYVNNSRFEDNKAYVHGGAIHLQASSVTLNNTIFYENEANNGGALFVGGAGLTNYVYNSNFENNTANDGHGGAINWLASEGHIIASNFTGNTAGVGGAIYLNGNSSNSRIVNVTFRQNSAKHNGGAIDWNATGGQLYNTTFIGNTAEYGAALCRENNATGGSGRNNTFIANHAYKSGAALAWLGAKGISINTYYFYNNTADISGAAIFVGDDSDNCKVINSKFENNTVFTGRGGDIDIVASNATIINSTFKNSISLHGGSIYIGDDSHNDSIINSSFTSARSLNDGGAIEVHGDNFNVSNSNFTASFSLSEGAAIAGYDIENVTIANSIFKYGVAAGAQDIYGNSHGEGGAIYLENSKNFNVTNSTFIKNEARAHGSSISTLNCNDTNIYNVTFKGETGGYGVISIVDSYNATIQLASFNYTGSIYEGGAIYIKNSNATVKDSSFNDTKAGWGYGGAIYVDGNATMDNLTFKNYMASKEIGSAIYFKSGNSTLDNSKFNGTDSIWINKDATVHLTKNNVTDASEGTYAVWDEGKLYLDGNNFDSPIYVNNGTIETQTYTYMLDNKTWNTTINDTFEFWASIFDDNNNTIICVDSLNSSNQLYPDSSYVMPYNHITLKTYLQGVFYLRAFDDHLKMNQKYNGTLYVRANTKMDLTYSDVSKETITITAVIHDKVTFPIGGNVTFKMGDRSYVATVLEGGIATWTLNNLTAGIYTVTASYSGDDLYWPCDNSTQFEIKLRKTIISLQVNNVTYGSQTIALVTTNANGTVIFSINGKSLGARIIDEDGKISLTVPYLLDPGVYSMNIIYPGNEYYEFTMNNTTFDVYKVNTTVKAVPFEQIKVGDKEVIVVQVNENSAIRNASGFVKITIGDEEYYKTLNSTGGAKFNIHDLEKGDYNNIKVEYLGDDYFNGNSTETSFTVGQSEDYVISVIPENITYGENATIIVVVPDSVTENVIIYVDDEKYNRTAENGIVKLVVSGLTVGNHVVNVTYPGDDKWALKYNNGTSFKVTGTADYNINLTVTPDEYGKDTVITVEVPKDVTENITISVDGINYSRKANAQGIATLTLNNLTGGTHSVIATYGGDSTYLKKSNATTFAVDPAASSIDVEFTTPQNVDDDVTVTVRMEQEINANVTLNINGQNYTVKLTNGVGSYVVSGLANNTYNVKAIFSGNENYTASNSAVKQLAINKLTSEVNVTNVTIEVGQTAVIKINVTKGATGNVSVTVDGKTQIIGLVDSNAIAYVSGLTNRTYDITVKYLGDGKYQASENLTQKVMVNKIEDFDFTVIVSDAKVGENTTVTVIVPGDADGNITIGDKTAKVKDGKATIVLDKETVPGDKEITISYANGSKYHNTSKTHTYDVDKPNSNVSISVESIFTIGDDVVITLTPVNGTASVKINGETYAVNNNQVTFKANVTGNYKVVATIAESDDCYGSSASAVFDIVKASSAISIEVNDVYRVDDTIVITLTPTNSTGKITVSINGKPYTVSDDNTVTINDGLANATYTIVANVDADDNYESAYGVATFEVIKKDIAIDLVDVSDIKVGSPVTITANLNETVTGKVIFNINGANYTVYVSNANAASYIYTPVNNDTLSVVATFEGNDKYNANHSEMSVEVSKVNDYDFDVEITLGNNGTVILIITVPDDATGDLNITVDGNSTIVPAVNGTIFIINGLEPGEHDINVTFINDTKYDDGSQNNTVNVPKWDNYSLPVFVHDITYGGVETITVIVPDDATGKVNITVDGKLNEVPIDGGKAILVLNNLSAIEHIVDVAYESEKYAYKTNSTKFLVNKTSEFDMGVEIIDDKINITLPENAMGNVTVIIDGKVYNITNITEISTIIELNNITPGNHTVEVIYSGDGNYTNKTVITSYEVPKISGYSMNLTSENITVGQVEDIVIELPGDINGIVAVDVGGVGYYVNITNGNGKLSVAGLTAGDYTAVVKYLGDDKYGDATNSTKFTVKDKQSADVNVSVDNGTVVITLPENATGNVTVVIDGENYAFYNVTEGSNRTIVVNVTDLLPGNHTVEVIYSGDGNYTGENITVPFNVPKVDDYEMNVTAVVDGRDVTITVNLPENATGVILLDVNGTGYYANISGDKAILTLKDVSGGQYSVVATYPSDDYYASKSNSTSFTVDAKVTPVMNVTVDVAENSTDVNVTVELPGDASGNVTVIIDGKVYNVTNVTGGSVVVEVNNLTSGNHTVEVIYSGDANYTSVTNYAAVEVPKISGYSMNLTSENITVGQVEDIVIELPGDINGIVAVDVGGVGYYVNITNGNGKLSVAGLTAGDYTAVVKYLGDDKYGDATNSTKFTVKDKQSADVNVSVDNGTVVITLPENATGNVTVVIDGENYTFYNVTEGSNRTIVVNVTDLLPGNHTVEVIYSGDGNYTNETVVTPVEVPKIDNYDVNVSSVVDGNDVTITVELPENATGVVFIDIGDVGYYANVTDGKASVTLKDMPNGDYTASVTYLGDDNYASKSNSTDFVVDAKVTPNMNVTVDVGENSTSANITVELPGDATGNVTVIVDGKIYNATNVTGGTDIIELNNLTPGNHTVEVIYSGDANYTQTSNYTSVEIPKISDYDFDLSAFDINYGDNTNITVKLPDDVNGVVLIDLDGIGYYINVTNGVGSLELPINLAPGEYNVTATYQGNDKYASKSAYDSFKVNVSETTMDIEVKDGKIIVELPGDATGNVTITVDGKDYIVPIESGKAILDIPDLEPGDYDAVADYPGDSKYAPATNSTSFNVPKISDYPIDITKEDDELVITVPDDATGNVTVNIDGKNYTVPIENGTARLNVSDLAPGDYDVVVDYPGDDKYGPGSNSTSFNIPKISDYPIDITKEDDELVITVPDDATGNVTVNIDGKNYTVPIENGTARLNVSDLAPGDYDVVVDYPGDDKYGPGSNSTSFNVPRVSDYPMDVSKEDNQLIVNVPEDATGNVTITIDGKNYTAPIENGTATLDISDLPAGNHTVDVTYPGNDKYAPKTVNTTIETAADLIITVPEVVKYYSGPERLIVYVKDADGNNVDNITVTIYVNGILYTKVTSDGQASIALNLGCGNYSVTVEFEGNEKYKAQNVNSSVEILHTIYAKDVLKVYRNDTQYWALFLDGEGNPLIDTNVSFNINGVLYHRTTNGTGWAKLNINLQAGTYILTATNLVTGEMKSNTVTVFNLIESSDLVKHHRNDTQFIIRIRGSDGNWAKAGEEVTFNIHGVFYTRYSNETGHVKLNINLAPGEFIITTLYKDASAGNYVTVLPRLVTSNLDMVYGDDSLFIAKTLDERGNIAPHQDVSFNIFGIWYNCTTDDNGECKIHFDLQPGKYLITGYYLFEVEANNITIRES